MNIGLPPLRLSLAVQAERDACALDRAVQAHHLAWVKRQKERRRQLEYQRELQAAIKEVWEH